MAKNDITKICGPCNGTGSSSGIDPITGGPVGASCATCSGIGYKVIGQINEDLIDDINDIKDKVNDIKEKLDEV